MRVLVRFFFSPVAAVFFPASFFSAGAFAAGALAAGFFSAAALGGILVELKVMRLGVRDGEYLVGMEVEFVLMWWM